MPLKERFLSFKISIGSLDGFSQPVSCRGVRVSDGRSPHHRVGRHGLQGRLLQKAEASWTSGRIQCRRASDWVQSRIVARTWIRADRCRWSKSLKGFVPFCANSSYKNPAHALFFIFSFLFPCMRGSRCLEATVPNYERAL